MRWQHPVHGLLRPGDFLALAERAGTMRALTLWVLAGGRAVARVARRGRAGATSASTSSPSNLLDQGLPDDVSEMLRGRGLPAGALMLEVTEDTIWPTPRAAKVLRDLAELGVGLALDDFGTGYSSLAHLAGCRSTS